MRTAFTLLFATLSFGHAARGDVVHLAGGGEVGGKVVDRGRELEIATRFGTVTVAKDRVRLIERKSSLEQRYESRLARVAPADADARFRLGE